jgi:hypothetical protein
MLRCTKIELELLTDIDQILFVESSIRGGLAYIGKRYEEAGPKQAEVGGKVINFFTELLYIDANNLVSSCRV